MHRSSPSESDKVRGHEIWLLIGYALLFLGVEKLFSLQSVVVNYGRELAVEWGIYEERRPLQVAAIIVCLSLFATGFYANRRFIAGQCWGLRIALAAFCFQMSFIACRALSLHHLDGVLAIRLFGGTVGEFAELAGLILIAACCCWKGES
ncbi:hypothetical protein [Blastopirellula marina]|uniref:Uncharacterized protein n=1 Tax=Blastopirellula marina TaxID=124 RepID=A0A2S8GPN7_9BACT|nr:hypothetical protein [Blastopirellula marina]PQO45964.1 hypothetical protein C5Y93_11985 [Blastopirellula marina]